MTNMRAGTLGGKEEGRNVDGRDKEGDGKRDSRLRHAP